MQKFRNPLDFESHIRFNCESGSPTRPIYKSVLCKNGEIDLKEDGIEDIYAHIQSFKDSVDINVIVSRFAAGDAYVLEQRTGSYGDFVNVPSSYMDVLNTIVDLHSQYDSLEGFNGTFADFVNAVLNPAKAPESSSEPVKKEGEVVNE